MSDQRSKDIKTIARTNELTEKVDKAITSTPPVRKEPLPTKRVMAAQVGNGSRSTTTGYNGGGSTTDGATDADGNPVNAPLAPPPSNPLGSSNVTSGANSGFTEYLSNGGISYKGGPLSPSNYDPNESSGGGGSSGVGGGSRTDAKNQADPDNATGQTATDLAALRSSTAYQNATDEEQRRMEREILNTELGRHEVGQLYDGEEGPKYSPGQWTYLGNGLNTSSSSDNSFATLISGAIEQLNAIVGVDPDNPSTAVMIRIDGRDTVPSAVESAAANQAPWTSTSTPPAKADWTQGYMWELSGVPGGFVYASTPTAAGQAALSALQEAEPTQTISFAGITANDSGSPGGPSIDRYDVNYTRTPNGDFSLTAAAVVCDPGTSDDCPITAPLETTYPVVGLYYLKKSAGQWIKSQYDSEVPSKYSSPVSTIKIRSAITGDDYEFGPGIEGGYILENVTNPDYFLFYGADRTLRTPPLPISYKKFFKPTAAVVPVGISG